MKDGRGGVAPGLCEGMELRAEVGVELGSGEGVEEAAVEEKWVGRAEVGFGPAEEAAEGGGIDMGGTE